MLIRFRRGVRLLVLALVISILAGRGGFAPPLWQHALAQSGLQAVITPPVIETFPRIHTYLDIHSSQGFLHGLQASDVRVIENGQALQPSELRELRPGVQFLVVVNPAPSFGVRNSLGESRFDRVVGALRDWARSRQGSTLDDLSLRLDGGAEVTHVSDPLELVSPLENYQFEEAEAEAGVDILVNSIEVVNASLPREGMERAVLVITGLPQGDVSLALQNMASMAAQGRVKIFIWLVASPEVFGTPAADQLAQLAQQTGGQFLTFSGEETLPNLEQYLAPMRSIYWLAYESRISAGGTHELAVEIQTEQGSVTTDPRSFDFELLPPDPAFISPPVEILRQYPADGAGSAWESPDPALLAPGQYPLQVLVHFPDGSPRQVVQARLLVDGVPVEERREAPFDRFTWDLSQYTAGGQHMLQVEVVDSLGLQGTSILTPVQVQVEQPEVSPLAALLPRWPILLTLAVLVLAALLLLFLILGGRIGPQAVLARQRARAEAGMRAQIEARQAEQAESAGGEAGGRRLAGWVNRLPWPQRRLSPNAAAFLLRLSDQEEAGSEPPVPITAAEMTFGRDANLATLVVDDASLDGLHARLVRDEDGCFRLLDEGSVAGTWINYTPVGREGAPLEHGDILHIGRVSFRFIHRDPARQRRPVVVPAEELA